MVEEEIKKAKEQQNIEKKNFEIINETIKLISNYIDEGEYYKLMELVRKYRREIYDLKMGLKDDLAETYVKKQTEELKELEDFVNSYRSLTKKSIADWFGDRVVMDKICKMCEEKHHYPISVIKEIFDEYGDEKLNALRLCETKLKSSGIQINNSYVFEYEIVNYIMEQIDKSRHLGQTYNVKVNESKKNEVLEGVVTFFIQGSESQKKYNRDAEKRTNAKVNVFRENQILEYYEQELEFWRSRMIEKSMGDIEVDYE